MIGRIPAAAIAFMASAILGAGAAFAGCAEDLTRIEVAATSASPDISAVVAGLVSTAQARAKANDARGCAEATTEGLRLLGLPTLAPITLSTPVPGIDRQTQPPHPPASGSQAAGSNKPSRASQTTDGSSSATKTMGGARTAASPSSKLSAVHAARLQPAKTKTEQTDKSDWYVITSNVIGSDVTAKDRPAENIGSIKALVIDSKTRRTALALIETGGVLGFGGRLIAVPFSAVQFFGRWDRPMIRASVATLQSGPRVTTTDVADLVSNSKWRADLAKHFNVAPLSPPNARPSVVAAAAATGGEAAGDPAEGRSYVQGICGACHTFDQGGGTRVGPNLYGIVDRKIAGEPGFGYSAALKDHGGTWTAANLDGFLRTPQGFARGTTMPFSGISSSNERRNVIAYLESLGNAQGGQK
jgi:cytochrome c